MTDVSSLNFFILLFKEKCIDAHGIIYVNYFSDNHEPKYVYPLKIKIQRLYDKILIYNH